MFWKEHYSSHDGPIQKMMFYCFPSVCPFPSFASLIFSLEWFEFQTSLRELTGTPITETSDLDQTCVTWASYSRPDKS
jgi:hypothetical protein